MRGALPAAVQHSLLAVPLNAHAVALCMFHILLRDTHEDTLFSQIHYILPFFNTRQNNRIGPQITESTRGHSSHCSTRCDEPDSRNTHENTSFSQLQCKATNLLINRSRTVSQWTLAESSLLLGGCHWHLLADADQRPTLLPACWRNK